jgi:hypothetical protein
MRPALTGTGWKRKRTSPPIQGGEQFNVLEKASSMVQDGEQSTGNAEAPVIGLGGSTEWAKAPSQPSQLLSGYGLKFGNCVIPW